MLEKAYNAVVNYTLATTAEEIAELYGRLPDPVAQGLAAELDAAGDVHRYDAHGQRAYYFEKKGTRLSVWSWNGVHRPHEAGELIFLVVSSTAPLDEMLASECYTRATGRAIEDPEAGSSPRDV